MCVIGDSMWRPCTLYVELILYTMCDAFVMFVFQKKHHN